MGLSEHRSSLALVATLAVAAGCSRTSAAVGPGGGTDAALSPVPPPPPGDDGGGDDGGGYDGGCGDLNCPSTCPITTADLDGEFGWKAPHPIQSVCTTADIQALADALANTANRTWDDIVKDVSSRIANATCLGCIVTDRSSTQWGPIVQDPKGAQPNFGACFAAFPGSNEACGKAEQYVEFCVMVDCDGCTDQPDACASSKSVKLACAQPIDAYQTSCGSVPGFGDPSSAIHRACGDVVDAASTLCQGGIYDGGVAM